MFKCDRCHKTSKPREKLNRYPIKFRDKIYQKEIGPEWRKKIITSYGREIVKELNLCEKCFNEVKNVCSQR